MTNPNDPVFSADWWVEGHPNERDKALVSIGLTKREYFAAMAMQGFIQDVHWAQLFPEGHYNWEGIAECSKSMADALIVELSK